MEGTRLKCAETSRRVRSVSTGTSASSLMAAASSGRSSGIQNTRPNTARSKNQYVHARRSQAKTQFRQVLRILRKFYFCLGRYWLTGYCVYGPRCNFLHNEVTLEDEQYLRRKMRSNSIGSTHSLNQLNMGAGSSNDLLFTPSLPVSRFESKL